MQLAIYKRDQGFKLGTTQREQIQLAVLNLGLPGFSGITSPTFGSVETRYPPLAPVLIHFLRNKKK